MLLRSKEMVGIKMHVVEEIRIQLDEKGKQLYSDPNTSADAKEYFEFAKKLFSDFRFLREAGSSTIMGVIYFLDKEISDEDLAQKYREIKAEVNKTFILADGS